MTDLVSELNEVKQTAEFHAFSVRQLIAQRTRIFEILKLSSSIIRPENAYQVGKVLSAVERSNSQFHQDIIGLLYNNAKTEGFFVEFGACDGLFLSNTALLEKEFGWRGIVSEPMPTWHTRLAENRSCIIEKRCVWHETGSHVQFLEYADDTHKTESHVGELVVGGRELSEAHSVETITLCDMLSQHGAPGIIDFMSIDIEGGEFDILSGFDFDRYKINFLTVEQHLDNASLIKDLMSTKGYIQVLSDISGHDGFYVPAGNAP